MAMIAGRSISKADIIKMEKRIRSLQTRAKNAFAQAEGVMEGVVTSMEVGGAAFGLGVLQGRYPGADIWGIPPDLTAALLLHGIAIAGAGGEMKKHFQAFGDGALASYLTTIGRGIGRGLGGGEETETSASGDGGGGGGGGENVRGTDELTNKQLAEL